MTKRRNRESCLVLEMPSGRDLLRRITTGLGITNDGESAHAPKLARRSSAVAMKSRKMNVEDGLSSAFAGSLSVTRPTGPNPRALPPPHIIAPTRQHTYQAQHAVPCVSRCHLIQPCDDLLLA